jgi:hypothetical protein
MSLSRRPVQRPPPPPSPLPRPSFSYSTRCRTIVALSSSERSKSTSSSSCIQSAEVMSLSRPPIQRAPPPPPRLCLHRRGTSTGEGASEWLPSSGRRTGGRVALGRALRDGHAAACRVLCTSLRTHGTKALAGAGSRGSTCVCAVWSGSTSADSASVCAARHLTQGHHGAQKP